MSSITFEESSSILTLANFHFSKDWQLKNELVVITNNKEHGEHIKFENFEEFTTFIKTQISKFDFTDFSQIKIGDMVAILEESRGIVIYIPYTVRNYECIGHEIPSEYVEGSLQLWHNDRKEPGNNKNRTTF